MNQIHIKAIQIKRTVQRVLLEQEIGNAAGFAALLCAMQFGEFLSGSNRIWSPFGSGPGAPRDPDLEPRGIRNWSPLGSGTGAPLDPELEPLLGIQMYYCYFNFVTGLGFEFNVTANVKNQKC